jgi:hypothetical protein
MALDSGLAGSGEMGRAAGRAEDVLSRIARAGQDGSNTEGLIVTTLLKSDFHT